MSEYLNLALEIMKKVSELGAIEELIIKLNEVAITNEDVILKDKIISSLKDIHNVCNSVCNNTKI